jgi:hypothetical protein
VKKTMSNVEKKLNEKMQAYEKCVSKKEKITFK